jgi:hypothetical protein
MPLQLARRVVGDFHALSPTTTFLKKRNTKREIAIAPWIHKRVETQENDGK